MIWVFQILQLWENYKKQTFSNSSKKYCTVVLVLILDVFFDDDDDGWNEKTFIVLRPVPVQLCIYADGVIFPSPSLQTAVIF